MMIMIVPLMQLLINIHIIITHNNNNNDNNNDGTVLH